MRNSVVNTSVIKTKTVGTDLKLVSTTYNSAESELQWECVNGHFTSRSWESISKSLGKGRTKLCTECQGSRLYNHEKVADLIKNSTLKMELLSDPQDENKKYHLKCLICERLVWQDIKKINRAISDEAETCCSKECRDERRREHSIESIQQTLDESDRNIKVLSTEFVNSLLDLDLKCLVCNNMWQAPWHRIARLKKGCPHCAANS